MRKVAIFGGTFNPIHYGHLLIAETALEQFALDQVIWVPTYQPPHKNEELTLFTHRFAMVQRAVEDNPAFTASDVESQRKDVSYAIVTLNTLQTLHSNTVWFWIIGIDAFQSLSKWVESETLAAQCIWLVAPRLLSDSHTSLQICHQVAANITAPLRWHLLDMPCVGISSSFIRNARQHGRSIRYLVPETVRHYVLEFKLYTK